MTFKSWEENCQSEFSIDINRNAHRDIYRLPNEKRLIVDTIASHNFFIPIRENVHIDYLIPLSDSSILKAGGEVEQWYEPEGYGHPVFHGENALEKAFTYAMGLK